LTDASTIIIDGRTSRHHHRRSDQEDEEKPSSSSSGGKGKAQRPSPLRRAKRPSASAVAAAARQGKKLGKIFGRGNHPAAAPHLPDEDTNEGDEESYGRDWRHAPALDSLLRRLRREAAAGHPRRDGARGVNVKRAKYLLEASANSPRLAAALYWESAALEDSDDDGSGDGASDAGGATARGQETNDQHQMRSSAAFPMGDVAAAQSRAEAAAIAAETRRNGNSSGGNSSGGNSSGGGNSSDIPPTLDSSAAAPSFRLGQVGQRGRS
jgi:hypothetical protein